MALLDIDEVQARAILDMQLRRLAAMERQKIIDQLAELEREIADLEDILANEAAAARRSSARSCRRSSTSTATSGARQIIPADGDLSMEDLIPDEDVVVTITRGGYAKRTKADLYRVQKRGGKGVRGAALQGRRHGRALLLARPTTTGCCSSPRPAGSTAPRPTTCPSRRATRRAATSPGCCRSSPTSRSPRCWRSATTSRRRTSCSRPAAGYVKKTRLDRLQLPAPGRRHRDQLPRGRRRADRRRAGHGRRRPAAGLAQGPVGPVPRRRQPAAADGPGDVRRHRHEVPRRRRAAVDVGRRVTPAMRPTRTHRSVRLHRRPTAAGPSAPRVGSTACRAAAASASRR